MKYQEYLNRVIDESIADLDKYFALEPRVTLLYHKASLAGLEACRGLAPPGLAMLLDRAQRIQRLALRKTAHDRYMKVTFFLHEVEWVCDVVSVALANQGMETIIPPTMVAAELASEITQNEQEHFSNN